MTDEKKYEWKPQVQVFHVLVARYAQLISLCIFCLIVSVSQGMKASYNLKRGEKSSIQNLLSTNQAKLLDFLVPLLGKLK